MRISLVVCFVAVSASLLSLARGVRADEEEKYVLPVSYPERGITNPAGILSPVVDLDFARIPGAGATAVGPGVTPMGTSAQIGTGLAVGAGYAITNDFGVRATVLSLSLTPSPVYYTGVTGGATYRFLRGSFEMGIALDGGVQLPVPNTNGSAFGLIAPSIPMHIHIGKPARLDITPTFPIEAGAPGAEAGKSTYVGLSVPVQLAIDIIEPLHVGVTTGYGMILNPPTGETAGDSVFIPVGFIAGYAIAGSKGPIVDLDPFFAWPELLTPGVPSPGSKADSGIYTFGLEATVYLYL